MFDERMALKMRLEQMEHAEERLLSELRKERGFIYARLRELDKDLDGETESLEQIKLLETTNSLLEAPTIESEPSQIPAKARKGRPSRRSKTTKMRETVIEILKDIHTPIRGSVLQKQIEDRTGFRIANMTTFMNTIERADENIKKIGRGLYVYKQENEEAHKVELEFSKV